MQLQLIHGQFSKDEAIDIITQLINVKIKFHENKIDAQSNEEAVKMREKRIKDLQHELQQAREYIKANGATIAMESIVHL